MKFLRAMTSKLGAGGAILALALWIGGCGDDQSARPETPTDGVTVGQILADPAAYDGSEVNVVDASVVPIEGVKGFVLKGDEGRLVVYAPSGVPSVKPGRIGPVRVEVVRFSEAPPDALGEELADADEVAAAPTDIGDPFLLLRALPSASSA